MQITELVEKMILREMNKFEIPEKSNWRAVFWNELAEDLEMLDADDFSVGFIKFKLAEYYNFLVLQKFPGD